MTEDTKALVERAREVAGYKYQHHTIHVPVVLNLLADTIERLERELDEARGVSLAYTLSLSSLEGRCNDLLDELSALARERDALAGRCEKLREDAERLDAIERCIRDGSYRSILNDIIAVCERSYATLGPGPALRSAIDGCLAAPKDAP